MAALAFAAVVAAGVVCDKLQWRGQKPLLHASTSQQQATTTSSRPARYPPSAGRVLGLAARDRRRQQRNLQPCFAQQLHQLSTEEAAVDEHVLGRLRGVAAAPAAQGGPNQYAAMAYLSTMVGADSVGQLLSRCEELTEVGVATLHNTSEFLVALGVRPSDLATLAMRHPAVFTYGELRLHSTTDYLQGLGFTRAQFGKALVRFPEVFSLDVQSELERTVSYLRHAGKCQDVAAAIASCPQALSWSIPRLSTNMHWLVPDSLQQK
eukprot:jgi/Chlat1/2349/Chrsp17S02615